MKKWSGWRPEYANEKYDVIIIGSGISGLCSAALLGMEGKKVLLLEKHFKVGGYTHTFKRDSYEWDVGIHYIGAVHNKRSFVRRLFDKITDNNLKWNKTDRVYDRIIFPDKRYDLISPKEEFIKQMKSYFPNESNAIDRYIEILDTIKKHSYRYFSTKALSGVPELLLYRYLSNQFFKYSDKSSAILLVKVVTKTL